MSKNEIGLKLDGVITLDLFNQALSNFTAFVQNLSEEIAGFNVVEWRISELKVGSGFVSVAGFSEKPIDVERVVIASRLVTESLASGIPVPYSDEVENAAINIAGIINGKIKSVQFFAGDADAVVINQPIQIEPEKRVEKRDFGTVIGVVSSISDRPDVKISLYDELGDRRIICHLSRENAEIARDSWRKKVAVTGWVKRDHDTGRAIDIRDIADIEVLPQVENGFLKARGINFDPENTERAEDIIRRLRDGD